MTEYKFKCVCHNLGATMEDVPAVATDPYSLQFTVIRLFKFAFVTHVCLDHPLGQRVPLKAICLKAFFTSLQVKEKMGNFCHVLAGHVQF